MNDGRMFFSPKFNGAINCRKHPFGNVTLQLALTGSIKSKDEFVLSGGKGYIFDLDQKTRNKMEIFDMYRGVSRKPRDVFVLDFKLGSR